MIPKIVFCSVAFSFAVSYIASRCLFKNADKFRMGKRVYAERVRLHGKGVPRLGGLAIYVAFYATLFIFYIFRNNYFQNHGIKFVGIFLASTVIIACGLYDDLIKRLSYKIKFTSQIIAAIILVLFGFRINSVTNPFNGEIHIGILGIFLIVAWIVIIMNAINLMDGLDGLACGIAVLVSLGFSTVEIYRNNIFTILIVTSFIGANAAFLRYNFYPAKLFLGDSGSFFLGFVLGVLAIESSIKRTTAVSLIVPLLTLFMPIASVIFTFSRRIAYAKNPFKPDKKHMHYRFLSAGMSHRDTVLIYYTVSITYVALGAFCFFMPKRYELAIITFAVITMWALYMWALHFVNLREKPHKKSH